MSEHCVNFVMACVWTVVVAVYCYAWGRIDGRDADTGNAGRRLIWKQNKKGENK